MQVYSSCVTISNPDSLSSSETGVNPGIRSRKMHLSDWAWCQKAIGGIYFTKKWRAETLEPGLEFNNLKPGLKRYLQMHLLAERFVFLEVMIDVFCTGSQNLFITTTPMCPLNLPCCVLTIVYGSKCNKYNEQIRLLEAHRMNMNRV